MKSSCTLGVLVLAIASGNAAVATEVSGTIPWPYGAPIHGQAEFELSQPAVIKSTPGRLVPVKIRCPIVKGQVVPGCAIPGNDVIKPSGTIYRLRVVDDRGGVVIPYEPVVVSGSRVDIQDLLAAGGGAAVSAAQRSKGSAAPGHRESSEGPGDDTSRSGRTVPRDASSSLAHQGMLIVDGEMFSSYNDAAAALPPDHEGVVIVPPNHVATDIVPAKPEAISLFDLRTGSAREPLTGSAGSQSRSYPEGRASIDLSFHDNRYTMGSGDGSADQGRPTNFRVRNVFAPSGESGSIDSTHYTAAFITEHAATDIQSPNSFRSAALIASSQRNAPGARGTIWSILSQQKYSTGSLGRGGLDSAVNIQANVNNDWHDIRVSGGPAAHAFRAESGGKFHPAAALEVLSTTAANSWDAGVLVDSADSYGLYVRGRVHSPAAAIRVDSGAIQFQPGTTTSIGGGAPIKGVLHGLANVQLSRLHGQAATELTAAVPGAKVGDPCFASPSGEIAPELIWSCYVPAPNAATIRIANVSKRAVNSSLRPWAVVVFDY